jgi:hypothetical protein
MGRGKKREKGRKRREREGVKEGKGQKKEKGRKRRERGDKN